jgi:hypothetical protein
LPLETIPCFEMMQVEEKRYLIRSKGNIPYPLRGVNGKVFYSGFSERL